MHVRPLHDQVIIRRLEEGEQKIGGIIIPDTAKEKPQQGQVIAVGNGKVNDEGRRVPLDVKAGDRILFGKYTGQEVKLDGEEHLIMREDDVLAVIDGGGTMTTLTKKKTLAAKTPTKVPKKAPKKATKRATKKVTRKVTRKVTKKTPKTRTSGRTTRR